MTLSVVNSAASVFQAGPNFVLDISGWSEGDGDFVYCWGHFQDGGGGYNPGILTAPAGFTVMGPSSSPFGGFWAWAARANLTAALGSSLTFTPAVAPEFGGPVAGVLVSDDGSARAEFDALGSGTGGFATGTSTAPTSGGVTTTEDGDIVIWSVATESENISAGPGGYDLEASSEGGAFHRIYSVLDATAGATGSIAGTTDNVNWLVHVLAVKPVAGGGPAASILPLVAEDMRAMSGGMEGMRG